MIQTPFVPVPVIGSHVGSAGHRGLGSILPASTLARRWDCFGRFWFWVIQLRTELHADRRSLRQVLRRILDEANHVVERLAEEAFRTGGNRLIPFRKSSEPLEFAMNATSKGLHSVNRLAANGMRNDLQLASKCGRIRSQFAQSQVRVFAAFNLGDARLSAAQPLGLGCSSGASWYRQAMSRK